MVTLNTETLKRATSDALMMLLSGESPEVILNIAKDKIRPPGEPKPKNKIEPNPKKTRNYCLEKDYCLKSALNHNTISDWRRADRPSEMRSRRSGWFDECVAHMGRRGGTDNDAIYIWKAVGEYFNGEQIYKVGVTSARLGDTRVAQCANPNGMEAEIVILAQVTERATELELLILSLGADPQFVGIEGYTEFRAMNDADLSEAVELITAYTA